MDSNGERGGASLLKEFNGAYCKNCDKFVDVGMRKCSDCKKEMKQTKWYSRLLVERIVFIPVFMAVILALSFLSSDPELKALPLIVPAAYVLGHTFMGIRFREKFIEGKVPQYAHSNFSIKRFMSEGIFFGVIIVVLIISFAIAALVKYWARN